MRIDAVDAFYLRIPEVLDIGDGSQDALLIRVAAGGYIGWGECEASPLPTIAALVAPISHSACKPVLDSVLGQELDGPASIGKIHRAVKENSLDLLQTDHALSGVDIALWDLLGKQEGAPVWSFFSPHNNKRLAYASQLFGDTPEETYRLAQEAADRGFQCAKFGWGPFGKGTLREDEEQVEAARSGLGPDRQLMIDAGCAFGHDVSLALERAPVLEANRVAWLEEPFATGAVSAYKELSRATTVPLAGGEGCHSTDQAKLLIDHTGLGFIQIDTGRVGGITAAREVATYAAARNAAYVNHTFTSNLALSASLQPYDDAPDGAYAEVPVAASSLAIAIGGPLWKLDRGYVGAPDGPGLGVEVNLEAIRPYLQELEIVFNGRTLWRSADL